MVRRFRNTLTVPMHFPLLHMEIAPGAEGDVEMPPLQECPFGLEELTDPKALAKERAAEQARIAPQVPVPAVAPAPDEKPAKGDSKGAKAGAEFAEKE